jgi:hypothetical protein
MDNRRRFLESFLTALGARRVDISEDTDDCIGGTVIYDENDPDETQDFCWTIDRGAAPSEAAWRLVKILGDQSLLSIDRIIVSRDELRQSFNACATSELSSAAFHAVVDELLAVEVRMVDEGTETDSYFIHE